MHNHQGVFNPPPLVNVAQHSEIVMDAFIFDAFSQKLMGNTPTVMSEGFTMFNQGVSICEPMLAPLPPTVDDYVIGKGKEKLDCDTSDPILWNGHMQNLAL